MFTTAGVEALVGTFVSPPKPNAPNAASLRPSLTCFFALSIKVSTPPSYSLPNTCIFSVLLSLLAHSLAKSAGLLPPCSKGLGVLS